MILTIEQLVALCPHSPRVRLELFVESLAAAMEEREITGEKRAPKFLAQIAHESAGFRYVRELASGDAYEPPSKLAAHLGNTEAGDGRRFKGRGLVQITGRKNYAIAAEELGLPLLEQPELLEEPLHACRSAAWFWAIGAGRNLSPAARAHGIREGVNLNELADLDDFEGITLAINGGLNGQQDRLAYLERAQAAA